MKMIKREHGSGNNNITAGQQKPFMQKHIFFHVFILSALLLSSCKSFPFAEQQDTTCARLIINTGEVSVTHEIVKESDDTNITDTDAAVIDYTDYTDYNEDKIVDLDDEPVFPTQPSEPQETVEETVNATVIDEIKGPETYLELASAYSSEGKYKEALEAYRKASNMSGADVPEIHYNLGITYLMLDDRGSALKEYKILEDTDPVRADTLYRKTVEKILSEKDNKYTVQVGAYKNINYAYETNKRLQKNHINSYIKKESNFNKVRVPGMKTKKDGEAMIKELRKTFGFQSVLLNAQQYP
jgi:tetratricopeptide (TPR) repeat protein